MSLLNTLHGGKVFPRRQRVLVGHIAALIPDGCTVLDVGTGDGSIAQAIQSQKTGVEIRGIDVLVRRETKIPVTPFDGKSIPYADNSFDVVLFVDVLHHTEDPQVLLDEAARVARRCVIIKDHCRNGLLAGPTLRFMDWVGNARFGVALPYNYWSHAQWAAGYRRAGLVVSQSVTKLGLYPFWANWLFGRGLHSIVVLEKRLVAVT
ncbi:MAG: methyltransferase domain-containing protein [Opitutaceae bacterium]|nr:methyltransferase domain-containing protein [Opitutaceae bacterium]